MSTQVKAAKDALDLAVTEYNQCTHLINRALNATPVNKRALTTKIKTLTDALAMLNTTHTAWVKKADFTVEQLAEETYSTTWLESQWGNADDIQMKVDDILSLDNPTPPSGTVKLDICNQKMETLQHDIT